MTARIHRIGTIFSRTDGLIQKKHIDVIDRPIWYDIYKKFPPKYEPLLKRKAPEITVKEIFYKEDLLRAKIHETFHKQLSFGNLSDNRETFSQFLIKKCQEYISQGMPEDEAIMKLQSVVYVEDKNENIVTDKDQEKTFSSESKQELMDFVKDNF